MEKTNRANKRLASAKKYVDSLQENYARLEVVRVDFGYKKPYSDEVMLDDANIDLTHMLNNRRSKSSLFKANIGYILKKEHTQNKGVHIHGIFMFDGSKINKGAYMGDKIGKYWEELTKGKGSYHNCNRTTYKYNGLGKLEHNDTEKRKILDEHVISYLCKDDHQALDSVKSNSKDRAFVRGTVRKSKGNIGRPRRTKE